MRLLLIEDELTTADLVCESLREAGYEVEHAADGRSGRIERSRKTGPPLADRTLPGVDGITIVQTLRQRGLDLPI